MFYKIIFSILFIQIFISFSQASSAQDFQYNKAQLNKEFSEMTNHLELSKIKLGGIYNDTDSSNFTLYDLEIESFCTGLCCGPIGIFTIISDNPTVIEKKSYWIGCGLFTSSILVAIAGIIINETFLFF